MSEADTEFRNLMVETLKQDGTLAKIRAQLRAHVFLTLENGTKDKSDESTFGNDYYIMLFLIHDFLKYHNLEYTLLVFEAESSYLDKTRFKNKEDFYNFFSIDKEMDEFPLLSQVLRNYKEISSKNRENKPLNATYELNPNSKEQEMKSSFSNDSTFQEFKILNDVPIFLEKPKDHSYISSVTEEEIFCDKNDNISDILNNESMIKQSGKIISSSPNHAANSFNLIEFDNSMNDISALKIHETPDKTESSKNEIEICEQKPDELENDKVDILTKSLSSNHDQSDQKSVTINSVSVPSFYSNATLDKKDSSTSEPLHFDKIPEDDTNKTASRYMFSVKHLDTPLAEAFSIGDGISDKL